jgi:hypothetical protein
VSPSKSTKAGAGLCTPKPSKGIRDLCRCEKCPTYTDCGLEKGELLYCFEGETNCKVTKSNCLCPSCPLHEKYDFLKDFYCIKGKES